MEATEGDLVAFLKDASDQLWRERAQPYLLSQAGPDLKTKAIDYRTILGEERLKTFVKRTGATGGYRLVQHPTQKPKVGIIPTDAQFDFADTPTAVPAATRRSATVSDRERAVVAFLRALSNLNDGDLEGVVIPVRVLAKILGNR